MSHVRQQIREAAAVLLGGIGPPVVTSSIYPKTTVPVIVIDAVNETSELENVTLPSTRRYSRRVDLQIEGTAESQVNVSDAIDTLAASIEEAMAVDPTLNGLCVDCEMTQTTITKSGDAEVPFGTAQIRYRCWYRTQADDSETAL